MELENTAENFSPPQQPVLYNETSSLMVVEEEMMKPLNMIKLEEEEKDGGDEKMTKKKFRNKKSSVLGLEEIQKHFHIPISEAAKQMKVGLTVLKKRCRQLNIMRWPHRKLKSLNSLILNLKVRYLWFKSLYIFILRHEFFEYGLIDM